MASEARDKTGLLGPDFLVVGLQECGTDWLRTNLQASPDFYFPDVGHLDFFTYLARPDLRLELERNLLRRTLDGLDYWWRQTDPWFDENRAPGIERLLALGRNTYTWDWYLNAFADRGERVAGEVCSSYASLDYEHIKLIQEAIDPRIIMGLRNPVDRLWSLVLRAHQSRSGEPVDPSCALEYLADPNCESMVTDYKDTVERWRSVFGDRLTVFSLEAATERPEDTLQLISGRLLGKRLPVARAVSVTTDEAPGEPMPRWFAELGAEIASKSLHFMQEEFPGEPRSWALPEDRAAAAGTAGIGDLSGPSGAAPDLLRVRPLQSDQLYPLRRRMRQILSTYVGTSVAYLPNPGNAGDALISVSEVEAFARAGVRWEPVGLKDDVSGRVVFLGGGGNLTPLYGDLAHAISTFAPQGPRELVLLPHGVRDSGDSLGLLRSADTVVCRERTALRHCMQSASAARPVLAHDMAFHLDATNFLADRSLEARSRPILEEVLGAAGWTLERLARRRLVSLTRVDREVGPMSPPSDVDVSHEFSPQRLECEADVSAWCFLATIAACRAVVTDRLHVAIGASLLGVRVLLLPNSYDKNQSVYHHSLARFESVTFGLSAPTISVRGE